MGKREDTMETIRSLLIIIIFLLTALTASGRTLEEENAFLHKQINEQSPAVMIAHIEQRAAVAAACDALVRLCPEGWIVQGREAQAYGFLGSTSLVYWAILTLKFIVPALTLFSIYSLYILLVMPSAKLREDAMKIIKEARTTNDAKKAEAVELERHIQTLRQEHLRLDREIGHFLQVRVSAEAQAKQSEEASRAAADTLKKRMAEAARWSHEVEARKGALAALSAFDRNK
jgi:hypothetical protein